MKNEYIYDEETELYYLESRYYRGTQCRFLNTDNVAFLNVGEWATANNLCVYCANSPITGYDPAGTFNVWGFICGALYVGAGIALAVATCGASIPATAALATAAVATATMGTGLNMMSAAANDSAMVVDLSVTLPMDNQTSVKYGCTVLLDYSDQDIDAYAYTHDGITRGSSHSLVYSSGVVTNYDGPDSYAGPFHDVSYGGLCGWDYCWNPEKGPIKGTGAASFYIDITKVMMPDVPLGNSASFGVDNYSDPIPLF